MNGHHLILGEIEDFITGIKIKDTHDERYRQKIARMLVEKKGYSRKDIRKNHLLHVEVEKNIAVIQLDFLVSIAGKTGMLIKYGPGSIVTRHSPALSASRITEDYQIPVVVVTNGEEADILDGLTGKIIDSDLKNIPAKNELDRISKASGFQKITGQKKNMASRILYAFEVDGRCPCDEDIRIL